MLIGTKTNHCWSVLSMLDCYGRAYSKSGFKDTFVQYRCHGNRVEMALGFQASSSVCVWCSNIPRRKESGSFRFSELVRIRKSHLGTSDFDAVSSFTAHAQTHPQKVRKTLELKNSKIEERNLGMKVVRFWWLRLGEHNYILQKTPAVLSNYM